MKSGMLLDDTMRVINAVEKEYEILKYKALSKSKEQIFELNGLIYFYSSIRDYFLFREGIKETHINACLKCENIIETLYDLYYEGEYLGNGGNWEEVEGMLDDMVREQEADGQTVAM